MDTIKNPNLSIVIPGGCNGRCSFCFWEEDKNELSLEKYLLALRDMLDSMPSQFRQISLTGGEPTLSHYFLPITGILRQRRDRWPKIVLTTNGTNLRNSEIRTEIEDVVDHINISRHAVDDNENFKIFGTKTVPDQNVLYYTIGEMNAIGIDVTANCVIQNNKQPGVKKYLEFAKKMGFSAVCFRKRHGNNINLSPTSQENGYSHYKSVHESECPV